jgi:hypothetical protein
VTSLPALPAVKTLILSYCPEVTSLPDLPAVTLLALSHCPKLTALPALPAVKTLALYNCPGVTLLPDLPAVTKLDLFRCSQLTALPDLPAVTWLILSQCPKVTVLPAFPVVKSLALFGCSGLRALYTDERNYSLYRGGSVYIAGCRHFPDAASALAHWGSPNYPDRERGDAYCAAIHAEELRRIETASGCKRDATQAPSHSRKDQNDCCPHER